MRVSSVANGWVDARVTDSVRYPYAASQSGSGAGVTRPEGERGAGQGQKFRARWSIFTSEVNVNARATKLATVILALAALAPVESRGQEYVVFGDQDGDGLLFSPRQLEEGPEGNIYVLDTGDAYIKVFTPDGKYLRRIGGEGEGPGEFQRADGSSFDFTPDARLCFTEYFHGHRWITVTRLSGELDHVLSPRLEVGYGISRAFPLRDGGYLVHFGLESTPEKRSDYFLYKRSHVLAGIDAEGNVVSEIVQTQYVGGISYIPDGAESTLPYTPVFAWAPLANGTVAFSEGMSGIVKIFDYDGRVVGEIETDLPGPAKVTSEDLDSWRRRRKESMMSRNPSWYQQFGTVIEKYTESLYDEPNMSSMSCTREGNILVARPWNPDPGNREYRLIGPDGKTRAAAVIAGGSLTISKHFILFVTSDEEGNPLVRCVKRRGDESVDLLALGDLSNP